MTKVVRLVPLFAMLAACSQSTPDTTTGTGGAAAGTGGHPAVGTGGTPATGTGGTNSGSGGTNSGSGGTNGGSGGSNGGGSGGTNGGGSGGTKGGGSGGTNGGSGGSATGAGGSNTACPALPSAPLAASDIIQINDNGGWSWYQDERAIVDTQNNKLIVGSVESGGARNGNVEAVIYDLTAKTKTRYTLGTTLQSAIDDHNAPAFVVRPGGGYVAMWSGHRVDCFSRYSIFSGTAWSAEKTIDWAPLGCPWAGAATNMITYSNMWYMGTTIYSGVRSVATDPAFLSSTDMGQTWTYYGRLTSSPQMGYVAGYYKYWGNNTDRIDFLGTEAHPRDFDNSLYHGYTTGGKVYDSLGNVLDSSFKDPSTTTTNGVNVNLFTKVFATGTTINNVKLEHAWNYDIVRYDDGTIAALWQARVNGTGTDDPDKRALYARFDGTKWSLTYLVKMGSKLYADEQDYTGLAALDPSNPHIIYVSTTVDPRDDMTKLNKHEIFQGVTCDNGKTFTWAPLTTGSTVDNLRPIVPKWDGSHTALLWMKGTYVSAQSYNSMQIVGSIINR